jgi:hypothetical protein
MLRYGVMENLNLQIMHETERSVALAREVQALTTLLDQKDEETEASRLEWERKVFISSH